MGWRVPGRSCTAPSRMVRSQRRSGCLLCARSLSDLRCSAVTLETRCVLIGQLLARLPSASLILQPQWHVACEEARDEAVDASHSGEQFLIFTAKPPAQLTLGA